MRFFIKKSKREKEIDRMISIESYRNKYGKPPLSVITQILMKHGKLKI